MAKIRANIYDKAYVPSLGRGPFTNKVIHEELFRSLKRLGYVVENADEGVSDSLIFGPPVDEGFLVDSNKKPIEVRKVIFYKLTNSSDAPKVPANAYRNFAQSSTSELSNAHTDFNGNDNQLINISKVLTKGMHVGDTLKARVVVKYDNIVPTEENTAVICMQGDGNVTEWGNGGFPHSEPKTLSGSGEITLECTETLTSEHLKNDWWNWQFRVDYVESGSIQYKGNKVEIGQDFTPYTPAPEQLGWSMDTLVPTQSERYLWKFEYIHYPEGSIEITKPTIVSINEESNTQQPEPPQGDGNENTDQQPSVGDGDTGAEQQPPQGDGNENTDQQPSVGDGDSVQTPTPETPKEDEEETAKVEETEAGKEDETTKEEETPEDVESPKVEETEAGKEEETESSEEEAVAETQEDVEAKKAVENKVELTDEEVKFLTGNARRQEIIDLLTEKGVHIENENATIAELLDLVGLTRN